MLNPIHLLRDIVDSSLPGPHRSLAIRDFAEALDWHPSYIIDNYGEEGVANNHLVVEHGLENSVVLTFLDSPNRPGDLTKIQLTH